MSNRNVLYIERDDTVLCTGSQKVQKRKVGMDWETLTGSNNDGTLTHDPQIQLIDWADENGRTGPSIILRKTGSENWLID